MAAGVIGGEECACNGATFDENELDMSQDLPPRSPHLALGDVRKDFDELLHHSILVCPSYQVDVTDVMAILCRQKGSEIWIDTV